MSDEGSDSWEVVEESSSEEGEIPEYADAHLSVDMEAFLASAAAFSQSRDAAGKADLVQVAADTVAKVAKAEASTTRDKLRRYQTVKDLIRHLKSFLFSTRKPSIFEKCFVESMQATSSAIESQGGDLVDAVHMNLQCFPLVNGEIGFSPTLSKPEESLSQTPGQGTESLGAHALQDACQSKDRALSQATSLPMAATPLTAVTPSAVASPAGVGSICLLEPALQEPAAQEATLQEPVLQEATLQEPSPQEASLQEPVLQEATLQEPSLQEASLQEPSPQEATLQETNLEDGLPQELVQQEATSMNIPGQLETSADTWSLRNSLWDSESIWTYDSSSCGSHSDVDEPSCSSSSSSSSYQVLTDTVEEEAGEAPSSTMVLWLARKQPEPSEGETPAVTLCAMQVLRVTAKQRPSASDTQPHVLGEVLLEEYPVPSGTETAACAAEAAADCDAGDGAEDQEEGLPGHQEENFSDESNGGIPEEAGEQQEEEAVPREFVDLAQRCQELGQWLVQLFSSRQALTPAQARIQRANQRALMSMILLLLIISILAVLLFGVFEVSRLAHRYEYDGKKSLQAYKEENRVLLAEIQAMNETIQEMRRLHAMEMESCRTARAESDSAWGAWEPVSDALHKNGWGRVLDQISAPLKKASTYMQKGVSKTLEDILRIYDASFKKIFKTDQVDESESSPGGLYTSGYELVYKLRKYFESMGYIFDSDEAFAHAVRQLYGKFYKDEPEMHQAGQSAPEEKPRETSQGRKAEDSQDRRAEDSQGRKPKDSEDKKAKDSQDKKAEDRQSLPGDGQRGSRQVRFQATTGPHRGGEPEKKDKGGKGMKFIQKLKQLGTQACMEMKAKEVRKVIKRLELLLKNTDRHLEDSVHAEVDCQMQWWGAGEQQEVHFVPLSCEGRVADWQLELQDHEMVCGQGKKAFKKQHRAEGRRPSKRPKSESKAKDSHSFENGHCGSQFEGADCAGESQQGHQYQPRHNQPDSHGNKLGKDNTGGSHQHTSTGGQEAEGKWYEEMMEQREHQRKEDDRDDWYIQRGKARREERKAERASDWFFDRHQSRKWWRNYNKFWSWMYRNTFGYFR